MDLPEPLNSVARRVANGLFLAHPEFQAGIDIVEGGHLEVSLPAPDGSQAGALVVCTARDADIWVHFAPPQMWYAVEDEQELVIVVGQLLRDDLLFARTADVDGAWTGTTLIRRIEDLDLKEGDTATVLSWSGARDQILR